jgi:hypothetical protein
MPTVLAKERLKFLSSRVVLEQGQAPDQFVDSLRTVEAERACCPADPLR